MPLALNPLTLKNLEATPSQAFPLFIQERTGDARLIVLRGRSLPYRGVAYPSRLRVEVAYFPGQPVGQAQVLGPEWGDTPMRGAWKDVFLHDDESRVTLLGFPRIGSAGKPGSSEFGGRSFASGGSIPGNIGEARRARTVRDAFYLIQRAGQLLRVEWGSVVRFGFLEEFIPTHDREEDIAWEMTWKWIGDSDAPPKARLRPKLSAPGILAALIAAVQAFLDTIQRALAQIYGAVQLVTQRITRLGSLVTDLINTLSSIVGLALVPAQVFGVLRQQLTSIVLAAKDLVAAVRSVPQGYAARKAGANDNESNLAIAAAAAIAFNARRLGVEAFNARRQIDELSLPEVIGVVAVAEGVTLRDIAREYYGNPGAWTTIADFNGLPASIVPAGTLVRVPNLATAQGGSGG